MGNAVDVEGCLHVSSGFEVCQSLNEAIQSTEVVMKILDAFTSVIAYVWVGVVACLGSLVGLELGREIGLPEH